MIRRRSTVLLVAVLTGAFPVVVELFELYWLSPLLDDVGHLLGGVSVGAFAYAFGDRLGWRGRPRGVAVLVSVVVAAVAWEAIETHLPWVTTLGFRDTWTDVVMAWLGAPVLLLLLRPRGVRPAAEVGTDVERDDSPSDD